VTVVGGKPVLEPAFVAGRAGHLFCVYHGPPEGVRPRGALVFVHAFCEEMNKSRHVVTAQCRALAGLGFAVQTVDLYGCGDSDGELGRATWELWGEDLRNVTAGLSRRTGHPVMPWGMRAGALLAAELTSTSDSVADTLLLWQPVMRGEQHLKEFLRLRTTEAMLTAADEGVTLRALQERLEQEETIEISGYALPSSIAQRLGRAELLEWIRPGVEVIWLDVARDRNSPLSPALERARERLESNGCRIQMLRVAGPAFWRTVELEQAPELVGETSRVVETLGK